MPPLSLPESPVSPVSSSSSMTARVTQQEQPRPAPTRNLRRSWTLTLPTIQEAEDRHDRCDRAEQSTGTKRKHSQTVRPAAPAKRSRPQPPNTSAVDVAAQDPEEQQQPHAQGDDPAGLLVSLKRKLTFDDLQLAPSRYPPTLPDWLVCE
ncbi:hypothetical protein RI367_003830 [Sorochytrium milnesiophthora]